jgi:hypothetical protein
MERDPIRLTSWRTVRNDDRRVDGETALSVTRQGIEQHRTPLLAR